MFIPWKNTRAPSQIGSFTTVLITLVVINGVHCQFSSPCPKIFTYEPKNGESDRWYGQITLKSDSDLSGVWLRITLDRPSIQLGNWFGEVVRKSSMDYLIKKREHKVVANVPLKVRFFIRYYANEGPPQLLEIRLNGKTYCPEGAVTAVPPVTSGLLLTSSELSTTARPHIDNAETSYPDEDGGNGISANIDDDDDYFRGDFSLLSRPQILSRPPQQQQQQDILQSACGVVIKQPRPLITHGTATDEGEFPWHAALYHTRGLDLSYICGASLVSKYHLITVAHCVTRSRSQTTLPPDDLVVYLGKYYLKKWSNPGVQDRHVERIIVHPKFSPEKFNDDLAILKLLRPAEITDYVRPICLWDAKENLDRYIGKSGTVVGWGFDESGELTEKLTKARMPIVTLQTCIYSVPEFYSRFTSEMTYCAGFQNGTSVCSGDSGGGMVFTKSGSNVNNPVYQIRGLVSISVALQNRIKCNSMHFVVFTDVAKYLDWIQHMMKTM